MADWQRSLDLSDIWNKFKGDERNQPVEKLAGIIADRLEKLEPFGIDHVDGERDQLVEELRGFSQGQDDDRNEFDWIMGALYDWADRSLDGRFGGKKVCWINTFARTE